MLILTLKNSRYDTYSKPSLLSFCFIMILKCICNTYRRKKSICMEDHLQQKKIKTTGACIQKPIEKLYYSFCQNAKIWPNSSRIWKEKLVWFTRERLCWDNKMLHSEKTFHVISGGDVENDKCEAKATMPLTEMNFSHIYPQGSICFAAAVAQ